MLQLELTNPCIESAHAHMSKIEYVGVVCCPRYPAVEVLDRSQRSAASPDQKGGVTRESQQYVINFVIDAGDRAIAFGKDYDIWMVGIAVAVGIACHRLGVIDD